MSHEYVEREGKVFEFGDYPDKNFSLTPEQFREANPDGGAGAIVDLEHFRRPHPLRGKLGEVVSTEVRGNALFARVRWPKPLDDLLGPEDKRVSCHFDPARKLVQLDLVLNPRIPDAALFAAADPEVPVAPGPEGTTRAPAFEFAARPAAGPMAPMVPMQLIAQDFHDLAASAAPWVCSGDGSFARGEVAKKHWALIHKKAMNHGATCTGTGRFSEEPPMSDQEKPAEAAVVFTADDMAAIRKQMADLQAENRKIREEAIVKDAAVFAENEVREGRAAAPEREGLKRAFVRAAMDDLANPAAATFSVGDVTFSGSRVADLREVQAARPKLANPGGARTTNDQVAPPAGWQGHVFSGEDSADPDVIPDARKAQLLKLAGRNN